MSTALTALRQRLLRELDLGWIIVNADVGSFAAGSITSANMLQNSLMGPTFYSDLQCVIFRPGAATSADFIRYAGDLTNSTGLLAHTGANYADTTVGTEVVEIWKWGIRPTREIVESLNRVLEFEFVTQNLALSHISAQDGDMAKTTDTDYTDIGTTSTSAKATTAGVTPWGPRSYHTVNNASANAGTRSASYRVGTSRTITAFTIAASEVGTSSLQPYDNTNSAAFGTAVTSSERAPQLLRTNETIPATCKLASVNLTNTSATGDTYWDGVWLYAWDDLEMRLPSAVVEGFMAPKIWQGVPEFNTGNNAYEANSLRPVPLVEGYDYWIMIEHASAEPYKVRFRDNSYYNWPLFVEARVPQSQFVTMAEDETATVNVPVHNLLPRWKIDVLDTVLLSKIPTSVYNTYRSKAQGELVSALRARVKESVVPAMPYRRGTNRL